MRRDLTESRGSARPRAATDSPPRSTRLCSSWAAVRRPIASDNPCCFDRAAGPRPRASRWSRRAVARPRPGAGRSLRPRSRSLWARRRLVERPWSRGKVGNPFPVATKSRSSGPGSQSCLGVFVEEALPSRVHVNAREESDTGVIRGPFQNIR